MIDALLLLVVQLAVVGEGFAVASPGGLELHGTPLGERRSVTALAADPEGQRLVCASGVAGESGVLRLWDTRKRELIWERRAHEDLIYAVAWSPDGKLLYTASGDRRVGVFSAEGENLTYLEGHSDQVLCVAVSTGGVVASGCLDGTVKLWQGGVLQRTLTRHGGRVTSLAFDPEGELLATGSADRTVRIWVPGTGRMRTIVRDHGGTVLALTWSGGRLVSGCSDGGVRELDPLRARVIAVLHRHGDWVRGVASTNGRVVSCDASGAVLETALSAVDHRR